MVVELATAVFFIFGGFGVAAFIADILMVKTSKKRGK